MSLTLAFLGDPNIGVFTRVCGDLAVVPPSAPQEYRDALMEELDVELAVTRIQESDIVGSLVAGNQRGLVVSSLVSREEIEVLEEHREVLRLSTWMNAAGNVILANDRLVVVHPDLDSEAAEEIGAFLGVPVKKLTFGGVKTVGMVAVATNKGILVHPRATRPEIAALEEATDLPVGTGSVNLGSVLVGSGLVANDTGYVAGLETSGFELGRIEEVFGFLE